MRPSVYLAGAIKGLNYAGATGWRDHTKAALADAGIDGFSPMRGKEYLRPLADVGGDALKDSYAEFAMSTMKAILCRDHRDCTKCDVVIVYLLGAQRVSIGTVMEVAWAHHARVPIILVIEKNGSNVHEHGLLLEACNYRVDTISEAIAIAKSVLLP